MFHSIVLNVFLYTHCSHYLLIVTRLVTRLPLKFHAEVKLKFKFVFFPFILQYLEKFCKVLLDVFITFLKRQNAGEESWTQFFLYTRTCKGYLRKDKFQ